jgi:hypothetical protein
VSADRGFDGAPAARPETVGTLWRSLSGLAMADEILEWPPDVFALTDVALGHSQAYRFAVSPPAGTRWPPGPAATWCGSVMAASEQWCACVEKGVASLPTLLSEEWEIVRQHPDSPLSDLGDGRPWRLCESLLTLHAIADEACAGMGIAVEVRNKTGHTYRAQARELLARSGSMARLPVDRLVVLPKIRTPAGGISFRSIARYACVRSPVVQPVWQQVPVHALTDRRHANIVLLPWPLKVEDSDFRPLPRSITRQEEEPYGFFKFAPLESLDLDLVARVLTAAKAEVDVVDGVILPELSVQPADIEKLEALLADHGVWMLATGVREDVHDIGDLPGNWVHLGFYVSGRWWQYRQNKHHRWYLDDVQIAQYELGAVLSPGVRWWEAMAVPRRSVQFTEVSHGATLVSLVCEDLARLDEVADMLRVVGPTLVVALLLDGPQLATRWTARYASVLADDPGSSVLTLTPYGFARRARHGHPPSSVVALWKDFAGGLRELALAEGAQAMLLTTRADPSRRRSADGRWPIDNATDLVLTDVRQLRAAEGNYEAAHPLRKKVTEDFVLEAFELTVVTSWSQAVADAVRSPEAVDVLLAEAQSGATWRRRVGLAEPSKELAAALETLERIVRSAAVRGHELTVHQLLATAEKTCNDREALTRAVATAVRSACRRHVEPGADR